ncbi:MAG TPA: energy transducer TonB [Croceicoccus sp.]|nr:energy transducer TonB [Croceicoccus sp.]
MAYADQQMSGSKLTAIIIVALIHVAAGYALVTGLAYEAIQKVKETVTAVNIEDPPEPPPPPPPPEDMPELPPPPVAPPPAISIERPAPQIDTVRVAPPPAPIVLQVPPPAAAPPPAPPKVSRARGVAPDGQSRWAARIQENYPSRALRNEEEGRVGVRVTIGPDGKVSACSVTSSSGSSSLDEGACDGMRRYARFKPALDDDGNPTSASWSTTIVYKLS